MANVQTQTTIIPHSQEPYVTRTYPNESELDIKLQNAVIAQAAWRKRTLKERIEIGHKFVVCAIHPSYSDVSIDCIGSQSVFKAIGDDERKTLHLELTLQMGRYVRFAGPDPRDTAHSDLLKTCESSPWGDQRVLISRGIHALHRRVLPLRCLSQGHRSAWIQTVHQA